MGESAQNKAKQPGPTWRKKLLLLAASLLFSLLVAEVGVRLAGLDRPSVHLPDPELGWVPLPGGRMRTTEEGGGLVEINELGLRDRPRTRAKPANTYRIGIFGDSMTMAANVNLEETFCYLLEEQLRRAGHQVEVLNFGVPGYSPISELLLYRRRASEFDLDLVILALFLDNDVAGCHVELNTATELPMARLENGQLMFDLTAPSQSYESYHRQPIAALRRYSALYRWVRHSASRWRAGRSVKPDDTVIPKRFGLYLATPEKVWEEAWAVTERVLLDFASDVTKQKSELVLLSVPAAQVVNAKSWANVLEMHPAMKKHQGWDLEGPDRRLAAFAKQHQLTLIQPASDFRAADHSDPLFYGNVGHFTPRGNQLLANHLEKWLLERKLLPKRTK